MNDKDRGHEASRPRPTSELEPDIEWTRPLNDEAADELLASGRATLFYFWASLARLSPSVAATTRAFDEVAQRLAPHVVFASVDIEKCPIWAGRYGIRGVPTMYPAKGGRMLRPSTGGKPAAELESWLRTTLELPAADAHEPRCEVLLTSAGRSPLAVLKVVVELGGYDLKAAKHLVDSLPKVVASDISASRAAVWRDRLEDAGGLVHVFGEAAGDGTR